MIQSHTYLYQRNGIYYFRLRFRNRLWSSERSTSLSLRTRDRRTAMAHSRHIKSALKAIHADNPELTYEEMRGHLKDIAEWELSMGRSDLADPDMRDIYHEQYFELGNNLAEAITSEPLSIDQHRYLNEALTLFRACMKRLDGNSKPLLTFIDEFDAQKVKPDVSRSVCSDQTDTETMVSVSSLFEQYENEKVQSWKPATERENKAAHSVLVEIFNYLKVEDANKATRADMLKVRDLLQKIPKNRKQRYKDAAIDILLSRDDQSDGLDVVTINNKYLIKLAAVFKWAKQNDLIKKNLTEGLELKVPAKKASEDRNAFSVEQVEQLLSAAKIWSEKRTGKPFHYFVPALAAITGARLNEVAQLQVKDIQTTDIGATYIHINENGIKGKSIKNAFSNRCVPLIDGAYGFVLSEFLKLVENRKETVGIDGLVFDGLKLMKNGYGEQVSKWFNRTLRPKVIKNDKGLAFHSFRHTFSTRFKQNGIELAYTQAIIGHSSGSIAYDRYAKDVEVDRLAEVLKSVFLSDTKRTES